MSAPPADGRVVPTIDTRHSPCPPGCLSGAWFFPGGFWPAGDGSWSASGAVWLFAREAVLLARGDGLGLAILPTVLSMSSRRLTMDFGPASPPPWNTAPCMVSRALRSSGCKSFSCGRGCWPMSGLSVVLTSLSTPSTRTVSICCTRCACGEIRPSLHALVCQNQRATPSRRARSTTSAPGTSSIVTSPRKRQPCVGRGLRLRLDLDRMVLRGVHHRRVLSCDRWLDRVEFEDDRAGVQGAQHGRLAARSLRAPGRARLDPPLR